MSLIIFIVAVIAVIYLIFKFIKKLVFAVFTLVLLFVIVVGGIGGLVYLDYKQLSTQKDFDVKVVYMDSSTDNLVFGTNIPVENQQVNVKGISGISKTDISNLKPDKVTDSDNEFVIVIDDKTFESLVTKDKYDLKSIPGVNLAGYESYDLSLTKNEVLEIMKSEDGLDKMLDIVLEKNNIIGIAKDLAKPLLKEKISASLQSSNLTFRQALFMFVLSDGVQSENGALTVLEAYKNQDGVGVYPDRFTFKLVRMLPVSTIKQYLLSFSK